VTDDTDVPYKACHSNGLFYVAGKFADSEIDDDTAWLMGLRNSDGDIKYQRSQT
jgi:hypothetical protein